MQWTRAELRSRITPGAIGMVHLAPLPGSPGWDEAGGMTAVLERAHLDAHALVEAGFQAAMVENFGDIPFHGDRVPSETIAAMSVVLASLRREWPDLSLGVNVLRNDAAAALGIAVATEASFIRVNVHVGAAVTDQGTLQGRAAETLRDRRRLGAGHIGILADLRVKHAQGLAERPLVDEAKDLRLRGLADAIIISGTATGAGADPDQLRQVRQALPGCPLLVGSGMTAENLPRYAEWADGYIVGTSIQSAGSHGVERCIDVRLGREFLACCNQLENGGGE